MEHDEARKIAAELGIMERAAVRLDPRLDLLASGAPAKLSARRKGLIDWDREGSWTTDLGQRVLNILDEGRHS